MSVRSLPAYVARKNFGQLLEEVYYRGDEFVIERAGKPMAKIVPLRKREKAAVVKERGEDIYERIQVQAKKVSLRRVERDIETAVKAVRARSWRKPKQ